MKSNLVRHGFQRMIFMHPNMLIIQSNVCSFLFKDLKEISLSLSSKDDFKPASVLKSDQAELTVGGIQDVSITIPNVEVISSEKYLKAKERERFLSLKGSSSQSTKFSGNTKSYTPKECLMIIDPRTGKIVVERLSANVRVKNVRYNLKLLSETILHPMIFYFD